MRGQMIDRNRTQRPLWRPAFWPFLAALVVSLVIWSLLTAIVVAGVVRALKVCP